MNGGGGDGYQVAEAGKEGGRGGDFMMGYVVGDALGNVKVR
jgi:hypothetical protein